MKKFALMLGVLMPFALSSCGSSADCSSEDVADTLHEIMHDRVKPLVDSPFFRGGKAAAEGILKEVDKVEITDIATLGKDESLGHFQCKATFKYANKNGRNIELPMEYDVREVDSKDSDFVIEYDESEFRTFTMALMGVAGEVALEEERKNLPPVSDAKVQEMLKGLVGASWIKADLNGDGRPDYIMTHRTIYSNEGPIYKGAMSISADEIRVAYNTTELNYKSGFDFGIGMLPNGLSFNPTTREATVTFEGGVTKVLHIGEDFEATLVSSSDEMPIMNDDATKSDAELGLVPYGGDTEPEQPSFDCAKASTWVETQVCENGDYIQRDLELAALYKSAVSGACRTPVEQVKREQRTWVSSHNKCTDFDCIDNSFNQRIGELSSACE